jgi:hypothetical protein
VTADIASQSRCRQIPNWHAFPSKSVKDQIKGLFPNGNDLRERALDRAEDIQERWSECRASGARAGVANFVTFIIKKFQAGVLIGGTSTATAGKVQTLINTLFTGVGLAAPNLPIATLGSGDVGTGLFVPGTPLLVKTTSGNAATQIPGNGFNEPTLVTLIQLANNSNPLNSGETPQFPPFYDINAANASGNHFLANESLATVGFCLDESLLPVVHGNLEIGHKTFNGTFEILVRATADEYAALGLNCATQLNPASTSITLNGRGGMRSLALHTWDAAVPLVEAILLPEQLHATMPPGGIGLGGRTTSFSPFGVVEPSF